MKPLEPNATIQAALRPVAKERLILIYGRPSVQRNCFEVIVSGLHAWQIANPAAAAGWQIVSLGESYPEPYAYPVQNFRVLGKVGLEEYAGLLSRAVLVVVVLAVAVFIGLRIRRARRDEEFAEAPTVQLEAVQVGSSSTWGDELSWDETPTQEIRRW